MPLLRRLPRLITRAKPWVPVVRPGQQIYVDGEPVTRNPSRMYVRALVTPLSGRQQLILPEGDRLTERYMLYQDPRQTRDADNNNGEQPGGLSIGDKVLVYGSACVVEQVKDWLGRFIEAQAVRIDVRKSQPVNFPSAEQAPS